MCTTLLATVSHNKNCITYKCALFTNESQFINTQLPCIIFFMSHVRVMSSHTTHV